MRETTTRETLRAMHISRPLQTQRIVALALAAATTACSIGIKPVQPGWDGTEEPDCTDDETLVWADGIAGGLLLGVGLVAAEVSIDAKNEGNPNAGADVTAGVGLLGGLVFGISSLIGESKYKSCHEAYAQWRIGGAIGRASASNAPKRRNTPSAQREFFCARSSDGGFCVRDEEACRRRRGDDFTECTITEKVWCAEEDRCFPVKRLCADYAGHAGISRGCKAQTTSARHVDPAVAPKAETPKNEPRGFYCSMSTIASGFCVRDKAECVRTRDVSLGAVPDLTECTLTEKAWCMGDLCFPTGTDCSVRAEKAGSGASCEQRE